ncbi:MAG: hypothetical protein M1818_006820 [Claussenomyces sp. TS43310]|nr:MAG: hypothetical protein M1818_006820 [Claussenomyces sp. TS43310]
MPLLRPLTSAAKRPSIHEIAASILAPSSACHARTTHRFPESIAISQSCHTSLSNIPNRKFSLSPRILSSRASTPPASHDRGPPSSETTQTDFDALDVLGAMPAPSTAIDACLWDGFHLNNGVKITGGAGVLLIGGEAFAWRPWAAKKSLGQTRLINDKGQWEVCDEAWGVLSVVWPKPDLLILGLGPSMAPLSPATRRYINSLGIRVEIQDTRNAAAQFNLLATERGINTVAASMVPIGWRENVGIKSSN